MLYKYRISFRNWVRDKLQVEIRANPHDRAFLEKCPWLKQLIPLGAGLYHPKTRYDMRDDNRITVQKVDIKRLEERYATEDDIYLVDAKGKVLTKVINEISTGWWGTIRKAELVYKAFERLGDIGSAVKHIVVVESSGLFSPFFFVPNLAKIIVYNFPKKETSTECVNRLITKGQDKEKQCKQGVIKKKELNYQRGKIEAEEMTN